MATDILTKEVIKMTGRALQTSKKQVIVDLSSCEAQYMATSFATWQAQ